ncbi:MAG: hypothetical protein L6R42_000421 [Xanthoria sp. 1 TBL-2021]|nr:MAG: hypothetical protein L6R42_000421 [Xanthoria sp. 1 TBL-2021]
MGTRAPSASLYTFTETRIDLEALDQGSVVQVQLPASRGSRSQRRILSTTAGSASFSNEETYSRGFLASASSIYFSRLNKHPRSFLWRVLENNKILELRATDLRKTENIKAEATVILQLGFPSAIRKGGVALADDGGDALCVFVLTKSNDLFTLTIPNKSFYNVTSLEEDAGKWCNTFRPSSFVLSTPHRLVAGSPGQLVVALADGKLLTLNRKDGRDGSIWQERSYHDGKWGSSLRGLINWQGNNTVRYDGIVLDPNAAIAVDFSPSRSHLLTVCANHTFKIWNLARSSNVFSMDLLGQRREPQDISRMMLDPGRPEILRVFEANGAIAGDEYYAITYSPHDGGQFKIWAIRDADQGKLGVRFLHSDDALRPPDPDSDPESKTVWKVADFKVGGGTQGSGMNFWLLMRSNKRYKTYNLSFDLVDLPAAWNDKWVLAATETLSQTQPPQLSLSGPQDASEIWLEYLLYPGRYIRTLLETALSIYRSARKLTSPEDAKATLEERLSSAMMAQVLSQSMKDAADSGTPFAQYRESLQQEWGLFYQEVQDLDRLTWQPLTLTFDESFGMPCLVFAGGCALIRGCGQVEAIARNTSAAWQELPEFIEVPSIEDGSERMPILPQELSILIEGAAAFTRTFSAPFRHDCHKLLSSELWQDPVYSVADRIGNYYEHCGFAEEVTDSAIDSLKDTLGPLGSFEGLTSDHFLAIIKRLPHSMATGESSLVSTKLGLKVLVRGAQEMLNLHAQILFDLLMVVVFIEVEAHEEVMSESNLSTSDVFMALSEQMQVYKFMQWLASSVWAGQDRPRKSPDENAIPNKQAGAGLTVLESLFAADVRPQPRNGHFQSGFLTDTTQDLLLHTLGGNYPSVTLDRVLVFVQCNLLKQGDTDLASDFAQFQPTTAWSIYIRGRLHLKLGEIAEAAMCFKKAAYKMAAKQSFPGPNQRDGRGSESEKNQAAQHYHNASAELLSLKEAGYLAKGLPKYYTHIMHLFQDASYPSSAGDFARLAIQFASESSELLTFLLKSLFTSSLQTSDIQSAYTSLVRLPKEEQGKLLPELVKALLTLPNGASQLLELPWPAHFHAAIDEELADARRHSQMSSSNPTTASTPRDRRKILAAWRLRHGDFRGAAAALYPQLQSLVSQHQKGKQKAGVISQSKIGGSRNSNEGTVQGHRGVDEAYLSVINLMACIDSGEQEKKEAWLLSNADGGKRRVVTVDDVKKGWQKELDRRSVVEGGRWGFGMAGDEMDLE